MVGGSRRDGVGKILKGWVKHLRTVLRNELSGEAVMEVKEHRRAGLGAQQ